VRTNGTIWLWLLLVSGILLILSVLLAMFPIFGTHGQHLCIVIHRIAAIVSIAAAVGYGISAGKK